MFKLPPWAYAAIAGGLLLVGGLIGFKLAGGKIQKLKGQIAVLETEAEETEAAIKIYQEEFAEYKHRLDAKQIALDEAEKRYAEEVAKPPEEVTRWRTRWRDAPAAVTESPCPDQLAEAHTFLIESLQEEAP